MPGRGIGTFRKYLGAFTMDILKELRGVYKRITVYDIVMILHNLFYFSVL